MNRLTRRDSKGWYIKDQSVAYDERRRGEEIDRLAAYEDTGLEPEEIVDLRRAWDMYGGEDGINKMIAGIQRKAPNNEPLTLEELLEMDGEPVYMYAANHFNGRYGFWNIVGKFEKQLGGILFSGRMTGLFSCEDYGDTWLAYRMNPEEGTT